MPPLLLLERRVLLDPELTRTLPPRPAVLPLVETLAGRRPFVEELFETISPMRVPPAGRRPPVLIPDPAVRRPCPLLYLTGL